MSNVDKSSSGHIRRLKAITLSAYNQRNLRTGDFNRGPSSPESVLLREVGDSLICRQCLPCATVCNFGTDTCVIIPFYSSEISSVEGFLYSLTGQTITVPPPPGDFPSDRYAFFYYFLEICNATNYTANVIVNSIDLNTLQYFLGIYSVESDKAGFIIQYPLDNYNPNEYNEATVTASNACSQTSVIASLGCFLKGSPVTMIDGTTKPIESVEVGDRVQGAFGETNTVIGLHRPLLGAGSIDKINDEHSTTSHHPHVSPDKTFSCTRPDIVSAFTYGQKHCVILGNGKKELRVMPGLAKERLQTMSIGTFLQTVTGPREVKTIEKVPMSPFTQVYHLVVDGSHTFMVDGYAVTGWAREDDFDYDSWVPRT
jgi:hypothetical protein